MLPILAFIPFSLSNYFSDLLDCGDEVECNIFTVLLSTVCTGFNANCTIYALVMLPMAEEV